MNIRTERRGLGRGLGELFQRTDSQPMAAPDDGESQGPPLAPVPRDPHRGHHLGTLRRIHGDDGIARVDGAPAAVGRFDGHHIAQLAHAQQRRHLEESVTDCKMALGLGERG